MAKIGSPLQITERKGVQEPVMLPTTSQVSTNVPAQRLELMDYSIGQETARASTAVTEELGNLVVTVAEAYRVNQETKKLNKSLLLEKEAG
ncbi:uncharacterized protein METZ01_LOCUS94407, partial [marine metagenome]